MAVTALMTAAISVTGLAWGDEELTDLSDPENIAVDLEEALERSLNAGFEERQPADPADADAAAAGN
ncbi:MAG: hypothetical protein WBF93_01210, partial [Pirellulales bacterium]